MSRERLFEHVTTREWMLLVEHYVVQKIHGNSWGPIGVCINRPLVLLDICYKYFRFAYHVVGYMGIYFFFEELYEAMDNLCALDI